MAGNSIGSLFRLTSFGESHGNSIGGIIDGCPSGIKIDSDFVQMELNRRKPQQTNFSTTRNEDDRVEFLSGVFEGKSLGTPIAFIVKNNNAVSKDYAHIKDVFRPSHADYTYQQKYGYRDYRGGGRASARETISRVVAGAIAKLVLRKYDIEINAFVSSIGKVSLPFDFEEVIIDNINKNSLYCPDEKTASRMNEAIYVAQSKGDTLGGVVSCICKNVPAGIGEPVFNKLHAELGKAMLSINAVKGFEYGEGFNAAKMTGNEHNDIFVVNNNTVSTKTNHSGGVQGGISNGQNINFRVAFKPVPTLMMNQNSIDSKGNMVVIEGKGRHDVCVVPRAVPIVEAMASIVLLDYILIYNAYKF